MTRFRIEPLGDHAFLIVPASGSASGSTSASGGASSPLPSAGPDPRVNARIHRLAAALRDAAPPWLRDLVPAYASLGVFVDPERFDPGHADSGDVLDWLQAQLDSLDLADDAASPPRAPIEIPVRYGGAHGEDLDTAAQALGLDADTLVARHCAGEYTVAMLGFAPGFPYLLGLDPALALPRLSSPRTRVPAGSVAIGGAQTGIYPRESPGGWRLLGRTPLRLFDPARPQPSLLQPGDRVRFRAIGDADFAALERGA